MDDLFKSSTPQTLTGSVSSIPSPASAAGLLPLDLPAGLRTEKYGPGAAHASPSHLPEKVEALKTSATSGPSSSVSSKSAALQRSLASKLAQRLESVGSMEYRQTWKERVTPAGRLLWAHTASARPTSDSESTGSQPLKDWATPTAHKTTQSGDLTNQDGTPWNGSSKPYQNGRPVTTALGDQVKLTGWPTVTTSDDAQNMEKRALRGKKWGFGTALSLGTAVRLTGWATATATDAKNPGHMESALARMEAGHAQRLNEMGRFAGWPTSRAMDGEKGQRTAEGVERERERRQKPPDDLPSVVLGVITALFLVPTGRRVVLAPEFSLWLMGYPEAWISSAPNHKDWQAWQDLAKTAYAERVVPE